MYGPFGYSVIVGVTVTFGQCVVSVAVTVDQCGGRKVFYF
jgi:hypothetical protein